MKKLKISMLGLVMAVGIGGAVASKVHAAPKFLDPKYNWNVGQPNQDLGRTITQAQADYGCSNLNTGCAHGVLAAGQTGNSTADISQF